MDPKALEGKSKEEIQTFLKSMMNQDLSEEEKDTLLDDFTKMSETERAEVRGKAEKFLDNITGDFTDMLKQQIQYGNELEDLEKLRETQLETIYNEVQISIKIGKDNRILLERLCDKFSLRKTITDKDLRSVFTEG